MTVAHFCNVNRFLDLVCILSGSSSNLCIFAFVLAEMVYNYLCFKKLKHNINIVRKQRPCFPYCFEIFRCQHPVVLRVRCVGVFRKGVCQINVLLVIADNDGIVSISRDAEENDDRTSLCQPLFQRVNAPAAGSCLMPMLFKNICDTVCGSEAKRSFQFRKQRLSVCLFPEVPQEISGGIGRAFSVCLVIDTISRFCAEKFRRIIKGSDLILGRAYVCKKAYRRSNGQDDCNAYGSQTYFSYLHCFCI